MTHFDIPLQAQQVVVALLVQNLDLDQLTRAFTILLHLLGHQLTEECLRAQIEEVDKPIPLRKTIQSTKVVAVFHTLLLFLLRIDQTDILTLCFMATHCNTITFRPESAILTFP